MPSLTSPSNLTASTGTITISSTASTYSTVTLNNNMASAYGYNAVTGGGYITSTSNPSLNVAGEANFAGDVKIKGRSLIKLLDTIEKRLAILQPDPKKLKKFEALQKAYDHYKLMEILCYGEDYEDGC